MLKYQDASSLAQPHKQQTTDQLCANDRKAEGYMITWLIDIACDDATTKPYALVNQKQTTSHILELNFISLFGSGWL